MRGVGRLLIVAVGRVCFGAFSARVNVVQCSLFRVGFRHRVANPRGGVGSFSPPVVCCYLGVCFQSSVGGVALSLDDPSFVRGGVLSTIFKDGVGMMFVDFHVGTDLGVCSVGPPIVPPLPNGLSQFSP